MPKRRTTTLIAGMLLPGALLVAAPAEAAPVPTGAFHAGATSASATTERAKPAKKVKPVKPTRKCRIRQTKPRRKVPAKRFANCVVKAMEAGRSVQMANRFDDGSWNRGPARFVNGTTEASVTYSAGMKLVVKGKRAWIKTPGRPWVRAKNGGTGEEQQAWNIQELWVGLSSMQAYRGYLRSSSTGWTWTGKSRKLNGVRAKQYAGTPRMLGQTFDRYAVWLDKWDRPIRIESTVTVQGITASGTQDFKKWGTKVKITPPKGV